MNVFDFLRLMGVYITTVDLVPKLMVWYVYCATGIFYVILFVGVCPNNWIHLQGSCYKISSRTLNWNAAKSACKALGSNLVMVKSQAEQQALASKISQSIWMGLYRDPKDTSRWLWVDGTRVTYTNWYQGEPNNRVSEQCGMMWSADYAWHWNDGGCSYALYYVCETTGRSKNNMFWLTFSRRPRFSSV